METKMAPMYTALTLYYFEENIYLILGKNKTI